MKKLVLFVAVSLVVGFLACKGKKDDPEPPKPEPVKYGSINFDITVYDSLGYVRSDRSGIKIFLVEDNISAFTDAQGKASFSHLPYGNHTPVITKDGYEGPLVTVVLNTPDFQSNLPIARHSHFQASNLTANSFDRNTINVSFNLSHPIPPDSAVKVLVLGHATPDLSQRKFTSADLITVKKNVVTDYNVAMLPKFFSMLTPLDSAANFYVTVAPVSYGLYQGNLQPGPQVLGENLQYPGNFPLKKKWKH